MVLRLYPYQIINLKHDLNLIETNVEWLSLKWHNYESHVSDYDDENDEWSLRTKAMEMLMMLTITTMTVTVNRE